MKTEINQDKGIKLPCLHVMSIRKSHTSISGPASPNSLKVAIKPSAKVTEEICVPENRYGRIITTYSILQNRKNISLPCKHFPVKRKMILSFPQNYFHEPTLVFGNCRLLSGSNHYVKKPPFALEKSNHIDSEEIKSLKTDENCICQRRN